MASPLCYCQNCHVFMPSFFCQSTNARFPMFGVLDCDFVYFIYCYTYFLFLMCFICINLSAILWFGLNLVSSVWLYLFKSVKCIWLHYRLLFYYGYHQNPKGKRICKLINAFTAISSQVHDGYQWLVIEITLITRFVLSSFVLWMCWYFWYISIVNTSTSLWYG